MQGVFPDVTGQGAFPDVTGQSAFPNVTGQGALPDVTGQSMLPDPTGQQAAPEATGQEAFPDVGAPGAAAGAFDPTGLSEPQLVHIPCPKGHMLETPPEMIGEDVMCPHCGEMFQLREQDSIEHKRKKQQEEELADYRSGKKCSPGPWSLPWSSWSA